MPKTPEWNRSASAGENARRHLPAMAAKYFAQGRKLMAGAASEDQLHKLRLKTKFLRYTLELFAPFYGPDLESCVASLKKLQRYLGEINDCVTTRRLIAKTLPRHSRQRQEVERELQRRMRRRNSQLRRYWQKTLDARGQLRWWRDYLSRLSGPRGAGTNKQNNS